MQPNHHTQETDLVRLYVNDPYNETIDNIMRKLHKIPSEISNMSVAEYVFAKLATESIGIIDAIDAECGTIFTDFYILACLKTGDEANLNKYRENDLVSFYHILGGRFDFVNILHKHGYNMMGLIDIAISNNDIQLIAHILDNKLYDARDIISNLTTSNIAGDMTRSFAYIEKRAAFYAMSDVNTAISLFNNTDNLIMMKWMDSRGMLSHDKQAMMKLFRQAVMCNAINIAKWLVINGNYEPNYFTLSTNVSEEMKIFLKALYKLHAL